MILRCGGINVNKTRCINAIGVSESVSENATYTCKEHVAKSSDVIRFQERPFEGPRDRKPLFDEEGNVIPGVFRIGRHV